MTPEEISRWAPFLQRIPLFAGLASEDIARIAARLQPLSLPKGSTLIRQGDEPDASYIVTSGQVRVVQAVGGEEISVGILGRGEVIGEGGLLTGEPRSMTVRLVTTCEFLKLMRKDFEEILRDTPTLLLHLSRVLARRLVPSSSMERKSGEASAQLTALNTALGSQDRLLVALHLGLQLLEQTHRSVLLVDMSPEAGALAKALGLSPAPVTENLLRDTNLRDAGLIRMMAQMHPSGLQVLSLPSSVLSGRLYDGIYLFLNVLREAHDFILVNLGSRLENVEEAILAEADQVLLVGASSLKPQYRQLEAELLSLMDAKKVMRLWLGDADFEEAALSPVDQSQAVPWSDSIADVFERTGSPYEALDSSPKSRKALGRLARRLTGTQVGLAFGTGAALGFSLIGILKVFKKEGIPVDIIAGSSMGALVGGFAALGLEPEEIEKLACGIDKGWVYENLFWDLTLPRSGFFAGETMLRFLRSYFGTREFSDLEIPFACVATDIETGEEVVLREGRVAEAIRASCGMPLVFSPFQLSGRYLVDGGLVNPVPVNVLASLGADILIAADLTTSSGHVSSRKGRQPENEKPSYAPLQGFPGLGNLALPEMLKTPNLLHVFSQMIYIMEAGVAQSRVGLADIVIQPDLSGFSWTQMHRAKELIELGARVAEQYVPQIKAMIPFFADYCRIPLRLSSPWRQ